ncbi:hypothetical protein VNI00_016305 [Paramarasmius palmivorus]|uniref:Protein kinase domain-containing protein n=1 Tax=Paramarasmius palmivorus TaxID=297713 RepID=A0AAW0BDP5_9AGAR
MSLSVGDILKVSVNGFSNKEPLLRFTIPLERPSVETLQWIMRNLRSRATDIDRLLDCDGLAQNLVYFQIEEVVRSRPQTFSQVFFGRLLRISDEETSITSETNVCLKLFDEVNFSVLDRSTCLEQFKVFSPEYRLNSIKMASDMMRREYVTYDRLQYLQGTLLPHAYGFHEFELPDGQKVWGFFTEIIKGEHLSDISLGTWPEDRQADLVRLLRHSVRALLYGSIQQGDWHLDQIFLTQFSNSDGEMEFTVVLIDFAFTWLRLGLGNVAEHFPYGDQGGQLYLELRDSDLADTAFGDDIWLPFDDFEC